MSMKEDKHGLHTLRSDRSSQHGKEGKNTGRIAAVLVFGSIAVLIAKQEIPWLNSMLDRLFDKPAWLAAEQCRNMARSQTGQPDFSRLRNSGKTEKTAGGYYVSGVVMAVLNPEGGEHTYHFNCNVTPAGEVVAIHAESVLIDKLKLNNKPVW